MSGPTSAARVRCSKQSEIPRPHVFADVVDDFDMHPTGLSVYTSDVDGYAMNQPGSIGRLLDSRQGCNAL